ncbi:polysaccharide pyruvyl transferase family protein [Candidatus Microgenomates bacterium]|nr:polysaccharide pyruvyl transferase family protein [Candidatus Microgenomates bacterium]
MKKITVINMYGKKNIGDMAIRNSALEILEEAFGINSFTFLCESIEDFPIKAKIKSKFEKHYAPYGYAIRATAKTVPQIMKFMRFMGIVILSASYALLGLISQKLIPKKGFYRYIEDLKNADLVVAMGGGYFITSDAVKDFFGIGLNLLPFYIAKLYKKKIIILPSSFGPFASSVHEQLAGNAVKNTLFMVREEISLKLAKKYNTRSVFIPDLALYDWKDDVDRKTDNYFVLTLRTGLTFGHDHQLKVEKEIVTFVQEVYTKWGFRCKFIPMASNVIEENDLIVATRINNAIFDKRIFHLERVNTPADVKRILKHAQFSVCNRLHSAILSATVYTPFITMSYAHKTLGFMDNFNLKKWNLAMNIVSSNTLLNSVADLMKQKNKRTYIKTLIQDRKVVQAYRNILIMDLRKSTTDIFI